VYNFDPFLQNIPPVASFRYDKLPQYKTPSEDPVVLHHLNSSPTAQYAGATSTMTSILQHLHYAISANRDINMGMLSRELGVGRTAQPTDVQTSPRGLVLRRLPSGKCAIDGDFIKPNPFKELFRVGHLLEKMLTSTKEEFGRFLKEDSESPGDSSRAPGEAPEVIESAMPESQSTQSGVVRGSTSDAEPQAYNYRQFGKFLVRSQLDAMDPRLGPNGGGVFDLKTRAVLPIRMDYLDLMNDHMRNYQITRLTGEYNSYEREIHDLAKTMMFKYSAQARLGGMEGIFLAFHNLSNVIGFRYMRLSEMDAMIHGQESPALAEQELEHSFKILEAVMGRIEERYPKGVS
jgi:hypothetical protein